MPILLALLAVISLDFDPHPTKEMLMAENPDINAVLKQVAKAPPLPPPAGNMVRVTNGNEFADAVKNAAPKTTILLADGTYAVPKDVVLKQNDVTIRSESGNRDAVILDGDPNQLGSILSIHGAHNAFIADVTFFGGAYYGVRVYGDGDVQNFKAYNVKFHNIPVRGLKGTTAIYSWDNYSAPKNPPDVIEKVRPHNGEVRYCLFLSDKRKTNRNDGFDGDYISGIDMQYIAGWTFADNAFIGLRGFNGGGRGAIFIWVGCTNITVERNVFINCDRSICFGNPSYKGVAVDGGAIRDNLMVVGVNMGIEACGAHNIDVYNNRICAMNLSYPYTVTFYQGSDGSKFHHNIVCGHVAVIDQMENHDNHVGVFEGAFADPSVADLSLTPKGIDLFGDWRFKK